MLTAKMPSIGYKWITGRLTPPVPRFRQARKRWAHYPTPWRWLGHHPGAVQSEHPSPRRLGATIGEPNFVGRGIAISRLFNGCTLVHCSPQLLQNNSSFSSDRAPTSRKSSHIIGVVLKRLQLHQREKLHIFLEQGTSSYYNKTY